MILSDYRVAWKYRKKLDLKAILLILSKKVLAVKMTHGLNRSLWVCTAQWMNKEEEKSLLLICVSINKKWYILNLNFVRTEEVGFIMAFFKGKLFQLFSLSTPPPCCSISGSVISTFMLPVNPFHVLLFPLSQSPI